MCKEDLKKALFFCAARIDRGTVDGIDADRRRAAGLNFGTCTELLEKYRELTAAGYRVHICGCGTPYEKHCHACNTGCKAIGKDIDYVLFIKHSSRDYKAGKDDPLEYAAVCDIIARQDN